MGKIISIVNQKGGVGKTTTTINLGAALAVNNKKTLIIDFDQQANATLGLGINREDIFFDVVDFFTHIGLLKKAIIKTDVENLDLIPSSIRLSEIEETLYQLDEREYLLSKKLKLIKDQYDYILIDCPPSLGLLVDNALFASDSVIIPVDSSYYSYNALTQMLTKINRVQRHKKIEIEGILITKLDNRGTLSYDIMEKVSELFGDKLFKTTITYSTHIQEAPMHGKSVIEFSENSRGSKEYRALAAEIISNEKN